MKFSPSAAQHRVAPPDVTDIRDVFSEKALLLMRDTIAKVTGLSLEVLDNNATTLAETASMPSLCRSLKRDAVYGPLCAAANRYGLDMAFSQQSPFIFFCPCGLIRAVIPVIAGNRHLGGLFIGQVRSANAPEGTPHLQRLLQPEHDAVLRKQHIRDLVESVAVYDFSYFSYIVEMLAAVVTEAVAKETDAAGKKREASAALAMLQAKTAMLEQELAVRESALTQWRTQMNLDFFINALSSLSGLAAIEDSPRTQEMCLMLAEHLRHRLHDRTGFIPLREETLAVRSFLRIQKARFGERLSYEISLPEALEECPFPAQTLLPFVEAALLRGLIMKEGEYAFSLTATREKQEVTLLLRDNAPGTATPDAPTFGRTDLNALPGGSAAASALSAAILRLETLLGPQHEVRILADAHGSSSRIRYTPPIGEGV